MTFQFSKKHLLRILFVILTAAATYFVQAQKPLVYPKIGTWRGVFEIPDENQASKHQEVPFNFDVKMSKESGRFFIELRNGEERIRVEDVHIDGDSIEIDFPVYEKMLKASFTESKMQGVWINPREKDGNIPFKASYGATYRFAKAYYGRPAKYHGKWKVVFRPATGRAFDALGEFIQQGEKITGTFQTEYGDFRYLQGNVANGALLLSNFDGGHIYLFTARYAGKDSLSGKFYSGKRTPLNWVATRDEQFSLRNPDRLTRLKDGFSTVDFSIEDENGKIISPEGEEYKNKVRIIQISGTWCPNCMDETKFLVELMKQKNNPELKVIGLSFERYKDREKAYKIINIFKKKHGVNYDFIYAGTTKDVQKVLPMLQDFMCFPTMIILNKKGEVVRVHTGFYGPATSKYSEFEKEISRFIDELLGQDE